MDFSTLFLEDMPSSEELKAQDETRLEQAANALRERPGAFVGVSLGAWIKEAESAGIPHAPANQVATVPRWQFLNFQESDPVANEMWKKVLGLRDSVPAGHMVRWDPCAALDLKSAMAHKKAAGAIEASFPTHLEDDPRAYDIIYQYPLADVAIWSRPWVTARYHEGYPVEFRVFIKDSKVIGVANYYVQRALPESREILAAVKASLALSETLLASMKGRRAYPWMPNYEKAGFDMNGGAIHATLDFLMREDGEVLFLEAGPPFGAGAHPCAFEHSEEIKGVALGATKADV